MVIPDPGEVTQLLEPEDKDLIESLQLRLLGSTPDLLAIASRDGHFRWLSESWSRTLGWTLEELLASPDELVSPLLLVSPELVPLLVIMPEDELVSPELVPLLLVSVPLLVIPDDELVPVPSGTE